MGAATMHRGSPVLSEPGLRVLYLNYEWDLRESSGAATHLTELTNNLRALGHTVVVEERHRAPFARSKAAPPSRPPSAVRGLLRRYLHEWAALARACRGVRTETAIIRRERPDVVLTRYSLHQFSSLIAARRAGTPVVFEVNAPLAFEYRRYRRREYRLMRHFGEWTELRMLRAADRVIVVSNPLKAHLVARGVPAERITAVPNGVDAKRFRPDADPRARALLGHAGVIVGFVGSFASFHGIDLLKGLAASVLAVRPEVRLLMVGDGPRAHDLETFCRAQGVADRVIFTGHVPRDRVPGLMAATDVLLAPYRAEEFFYFSPIKLFEYMASGRAVLSARVGQIAEIIQDGVNGVLYDPADPDSLSRAVLRLVDDRALRERLGRAARATVERDYTWRANAERVAEVLQQARAGPMVERVA